VKFAIEIMNPLRAEKLTVFGKKEAQTLAFLDRKLN
jgi:hypothetical protein